MNVLVAWASKHGATSEIAEAIRDTLVERGLEARAADAGTVESLEGIDAVILGSAIYMGHWLAPARDFAMRFESQLTGMPVWLFSSGPIGDPPRPSADEALNLDGLVDRIGAHEHRLFAGRLDRSVLSFGERAVVMAVRAVDGDHRDWVDIRGWAATIAAQLNGT